MTDVLIVGAGPAGSVAALVLARAGVKVRLIDRAAFPRDKLCGDTVNPGSLALLDALHLGDAVRVQGLRITGMTVTGPLGAAVAADYPGAVVGASLTRRTLDGLLVDAAISAGVTFHERVRAKAPIVSDDGRVEGAAVTDGRVDRGLHARVVIAADGRASRLGTALGLSAFASQPRRWAFGAYYEGVSRLTTHGEMHVRANGYIGIAPLPAGIANVCVVRSRRDGPVRARNASERDAAARLDSSAGVASLGANGSILDDAIASEPELRERFAGARRISHVVALGPLAVDARAAGCPGLLLAGDAAGFVDPMTGDGLRFALRGGMLAAEHALHDLETGHAQHEPLLIARRREFTGKWRLNRALRSLAASPRGLAVAATVARHWTTPIEYLVARAGDLDLLACDHTARPGPISESLLTSGTTPEIRRELGATLPARRCRR